MEKLSPLPSDDQTRAKLWAIHATMHRPRVRWVLGTSLRRPAEKELPAPSSTPWKRMRPCWMLLRKSSRFPDLKAC